MGNKAGRQPGKGSCNRREPHKLFKWGATIPLVCLHSTQRIQKKNKPTKDIFSSLVLSLSSDSASNPLFLIHCFCGLPLWLACANVATAALCVDPLLLKLNMKIDSAICGYFVLCKQVFNRCHTCHGTHCFIGVYKCYTWHFCRSRLCSKPLPCSRNWLLWFIGGGLRNRNIVKQNMKLNNP